MARKGHTQSGDLTETTMLVCYAMSILGVFTAFTTNILATIIFAGVWLFSTTPRNQNYALDAFILNFLIIIVGAVPLLYGIWNLYDAIFVLPYNEVFPLVGGMLMASLKVLLVMSFIGLIIKVLLIRSLIRYMEV